MKTFDQFRRELADAVTVAINSGETIGLYGRCPLGVRTAERSPLPAPAADAWDISAEDAREFMRGFDHFHFEPTCNFRKLGRLYRQRFVEGK